ncbi:MAG: hypothetical protein IMW92_11135 [Bacillales bacterium]|nr:hypothetical protein [Bacillales bacterium]
MDHAEDVPSILGTGLEDRHLNKNSTKTDGKGTSFAREKCSMMEDIVVI